MFQETINIVKHIIYYIKLSRLKSYYRVSKRWIKQRLGKQRYNHPPTFKQWIYFISTVNSYYKKEKDSKNIIELMNQKSFISINENEEFNDLIKKVINKYLEITKEYENDSRLNSTG